ncbi:MAG TPA: hypothetical protein VLX28_07945 [Thermoanaerobaculia bacterium]|nr:hypothetical protein [Thermoanaerobaculia bacterium]
MLTRRTPWVLALTVVLLLGALDFHPAGDLHDVLGGSTDDGAYSKSAKHPNAPAHFEQFEAGQRPVCPICLHQLRTGGVHLPMAAHLHAPSLTGFRGLISTPLLRERCAAPRGARGPPST